MAAGTGAGIEGGLGSLIDRLVVLLKSESKADTEVIAGKGVKGEKGVAVVLLLGRSIGSCNPLPRGASSDNKSDPGAL